MTVPAGHCAAERPAMLKPSNMRRWGAIALVAMGLAYLVYNPDLLFEAPDNSIKPVDRPADNNTQTKADFDFYVLALSWSPSFCASTNRTTGIQCGGKRYFSFIVHGLWPQYEKGWPSFCNKTSRSVPDGLTRSMLDIMPGYRLIQNQWKKHGTCTGLDQKTYFSKLRKAYERIRFPARYRLNDGYLSVTPQSVEDAFRNVNPQLPRDAIAVTCGKRRLREVRICLSKDLKFRSCREVDRNSCRRDKIIMPPVRES